MLLHCNYIPNAVHQISNVAIRLAGDGKNATNEGKALFILSLHFLHFGLRDGCLFKIIQVSTDDNDGCSLGSGTDGLKPVADFAFVVVKS
jgi:hypothetical protein